ncbi:MAG: hypothetical protein AMXMBFR84_22740 [Candidatus Hydrogenedentota bacterium]
MNAFEYAAPSTTAEATDLLKNTNGLAVVMAGGTDLVTSLKQRIVSPVRVVSLRNVEELKGIDTAPEMVTVGAMTTLSEFVANATVQKHFPALVKAAQGVASPQLMSVGTVGGDLCQRPRCWYYRNGLGLVSGSALVESGDNRYHAIFGNEGAAKFVHPSSLAPALTALGAVAVVNGTRDVPLAEFFKVPSSDDDSETVLQPGEILTHVRIPFNGVRNGIYEVRHRQILDWPYAAAAVAFGESGGRATGVSVVLGHVAPVPWVSIAAAKALEGQAITEETAAACGEAAAEGAKPMSKNGYKVQLVKVSVKRAILAAMA